MITPRMVLAQWAAVAFGMASAAHFGVCAELNQQAIDEVKSGKRTDAKASWWGFDEAESTNALQSAIDSGAKRIIVENLGRPWIVDKIQLASNQEVVFEKGVVVQAKRGAFKGGGDCLFTCALKENVTLTGNGATLKMWKADYHTDAYKKAEWRHCLSIRSSSNVKVYGLTLADSGGDGIYLGVSKRGVTNKGIHVKDVVCTGNNRQGISVISAEDLLIENTVMKDTSGTAPMAGIDFEPNDPGERLVNCVMRNCATENNAGDGYEFYLKNLNDESAPISIRVEDCRSVGDRSSVRFITGNGPTRPAVRGTMDFVNCRFVDGKHAGIGIGEKPAEGATVRFVNCEIVNPAPEQPATAPIMFSSSAGNTENVGGVEFVDCVLKDPLKRQPMNYLDLGGGLRLTGITGKLTVERNGKRTDYTLNQELIDKWMPFQVYKDIKRFATKGVRYVPVFDGAKPEALRACPCRQRGTSTHLVWAARGDTVTFDVAVLPVGKSAIRPTPVKIVSPSGKESELPLAETQEPTAYTFEAKETGAHTIICEPGGHTARVGSTTHRLCAYSKVSMIHFLGTTGELFFWVPAGVKEFAIKAMGGNAAERVKASLHDSAGKLVEEQDNIAQAHQFVGERVEAAEGEIWSLRLNRPSEGVLEDFFVQFQGVPPVLAPCREALLRPE